MPVDIFDRLSLFQDFTPDQRAVLRPLFVICKEQTGTLIFEQGDSARHLYIVVEGEVDIVFKPDDGAELNVANIRPGGVVGWSAALGSPAYTSSAVCSTDCVMLRLRGADLRDLYNCDPETGSMFLERLAAVIAKRLRNTHQHVISMLEQGLGVRVNLPVSTE
jgi:CRP/FNR family cyclic AMP-dependent transcriptional regulator